MSTTTITPRTTNAAEIAAEVSALEQARERAREEHREATKRRDGLLWGTTRSNAMADAERPARERQAQEAESAAFARYEQAQSALAIRRAELLKVLSETPDPEAAEVEQKREELNAELRQCYRRLAEIGAEAVAILLRIGPAQLPHRGARAQIAGAVMRTLRNAFGQTPENLVNFCPLCITPKGQLSVAEMEYADTDADTKAFFCHPLDLPNGQASIRQRLVALEPQARLEARADALIERTQDDANGPAPAERSEEDTELQEERG